MSTEGHRREYKTVRLGSALQVVASVNYYGDELFDWAAYIGAGSTGEVHDRGDKLFDKHAAAFFPDLPIERYRH
jgi:hypothetical protein